MVVYGVGGTGRTGTVLGFVLVRLREERSGAHHTSLARGASSTSGSVPAPPSWHAPGVAGPRDESYNC